LFVFGSACAVLATFTDRVAKETVGSVRRRVINSCTYVAGVADAWPGVVENAMGALSTTDATLKASLWTLLARITESRPEWIIAPHAAALAAPAAAALAASNPAEVRSAAALCVCQIASRLEDPAAVAAYGAALPLLADTARELASIEEEKEAKEVLLHLNNVVYGANSRAILSSAAVPVVKSMELIASTDSYGDDVRGQALQVLVHASLMAGPQVRAAGIHTSVVPLLLRLMARMPESGVMDPARFAALPYDPDSLVQARKELAPLAESAEDVLDRFCSTIGGALILPVGMAAATSFLAASRPWNVRRAGIAGIAVFVASCGKPSASQGGSGGGGAHASTKGKTQGGFTTEQRVAVLKTLVGALSTDGDARVRYEAAMALSRYTATLCEPGVANAKAACKELFAGAIPSLATAANPASGNIPSVCAACCQAIQGALTSECPKAVAGPAVAGIMSNLSPLLGCGIPSVTAQTLDTVAAIASVSEEAFGAFYPTLMPPIRAIASSQSIIGVGEDANKVRAAAIVCLGCLMETVPPEVFRADAQSILDPILKAAQGSAAAGAPVAPGADATGGDGTALRLGRAALTAVGRIANHLGTEFAPFVGTFLPTLLAAASVDTGFSVEQVDAEDLSGSRARDSEEARASLGSEGATVASMVVDVVGGSSLRIQLNTDAVIEKQEALSALCDLATECGTAIGPFAPQLVECMLKQAVDPVSAVCRGLAATVVPIAIQAFIRAKIDTGSPEASAVVEAAPMIGAAVTTLSTQAVKERTTDSAALAVTAALRDLLIVTLAAWRDDCIHYTKESTPAVQLPAAAASTVIFAAAACAGMAAERIRIKNEDMAACGAVDARQVIEVRDDLEDEETIMRQSIDALGYAIKNARADALPGFAEHVAPIFGPLVSSTNPVLQHAALCCFVDVCEWCGPGAASYVGPLVAALGAGLVGADEDVRQVCCYGVGALAQAQPDAIRPMAPQAITALQSVIAREDARSDENEFATDNAISALAKVMVCTATPAAPGDPALWKFWLAALPVRSDEVEARYCHSMLVEQTEKSNPLVIGAGGSNVSDVLRVFGEVLVNSAGGGGGAMASPAAAAAAAAAGEDDDEDDEPIEMASEATIARIRAVVKSLSTTVPAATLAAAVAPLSASIKAALAHASH
jgi:hypothetical protein